MNMTLFNIICISKFLDHLRYSIESYLNIIIYIGYRVWGTRNIINVNRGVFQSIYRVQI